MSDKTIKILVVENVKHDYFLMERALRRSELDCEMVRAFHAKDALECLHSGHFDIVILDYSLSGETGLDMFRRMKVKGIEVPVVFVSGSGDEAVAAEAIRQGAQDYIVKDPQGGYLEMLADVIRKATEQWEAEQSYKKSQRRLKESEAKLRSFIESSTIGIWCFRCKPSLGITLPEEKLIQEFFKSVCVKCNETYAKMMGTTKEEILGMRLSEVMPDTEENREYLRAFIRNGFKLSGGISHEIDRAGKEKYFSNSLVGTIKDGKLIEAWGTQTDITEQMKAEEQLRKSEERLRGVLDASGEVVFTKNIKGYYTLVNAAFSRIFKRPLKEIVGKTDRELFTEKEAKKLRKTDLKVLKRGETDTREDILTVDGDLHIFKTTKVPLRNEVGEIIGLCGFAVDITERKRSENELRFLSSITKQVTDSIIVTDTEFETTYINKATEELFSYSRKELMGKNPGILNAEPEAEQIQRDIYKTVSSGKVWTGAHLNRRKDGSTFICEFRISPLIDERGKTSAYIAIQRDITDRRSLEEELKEHRGYLESIMRYIPEAIVTQDAEGMVLEWNPEAERLFGYTSEEAVGKKLDDLVASRDPDKFKEATGMTRQILAGKPFSPVEAVRFRKDGSPVDVRLVASPILKENKIMGTIALYRDITEQKRLEKEARDRRLYLENLMNNNPNAIIAADDKQRVLEWNPGAERLFGYTRDEVMGKNVDDLITGSNPDTLKEATSLTNQVLAGERVPSTEVVRYRKDGTPISVIVSGSPILSEGKLIGVVATYIDLTEHKREEKIRESIYRIAEAVVTTKDLNEFFGFIHDAIRKLLPAENAYITLYDSDADLISFPYFVDRYDTAPQPGRPGKGLTEYVLRTKMPILATPKVISRLHKEGEIKIIGTLPVSWLGVPLIVEDRIIGVVAVQSYTEGIEYTERDKEILLYVSAQIAQAISRKRAEEKLYEQMRELKAFHRITLGREDRIIELKHKVNELLERLGEEKKYGV